MIKYIGSKRLLIPQILEIAGRFEGVSTFCDLFSGTARVSIAFKKAGYSVHANDCMAYAHTLAKTYVETDADAIDSGSLAASIARLNALAPVDGYFTRKFAREARYFQEENALRIDAIRGAIDSEPAMLRHLLLTSLILAADRVDSTVGVQMAYLKGWSERSFHAMELRPPELVVGPGLATQRDALEIAPEIDADLVYLDPPYNQHSYLGNYHVWESLVLNDSPETYGKANKRIDCRTRPSPFNLKSQAKDALEQVLFSLKSKRIILSFNDEGYIPRSDLESMLGRWGTYDCLAVPYRRHVGSKIGIYNLKGEKVGSPSYHGNREFLFFAQGRS